jgi:3,4-dihydroxy 2-butanone 4-phosphate synthase / GTP cyclohydrolase II
MENSSFIDVPAALEEIRVGRMIVVVDVEGRENEGDLTMAAKTITREAVNFMARQGRGLICLVMTEERLEELDLHPMAVRNTARFGTAFMESIDALGRGVTTGISAYDRGQTIRCALDSAIRAFDLCRPGTPVSPSRAMDRRGPAST